MATPKKKLKQKQSRGPWVTIILLAGIALFFLFMPQLFVLKREYTVSQKPEPFPVGVFPKQKLIVENPAATQLFPNQTSPLTAAVVNANNMFDSLAVAIGSSPWYEAIGATDTRFVTINPGFRKEQIAAAFGKSLLWTSSEETSFLTPGTDSLNLSEGDFAPGTYVVGLGTTPAEARSLVSNQFAENVLSHYSTSTEAIVPLSETLTIASMIERETSDPNEMRVISGIIWNRIFAGMKLQIDSTVQYAIGTPQKWWPILTLKDETVKSPYNTYLNTGLPPGPISDPGVAAVIAALNPVQTPCLFYFNDASGTFHCSETYAEQVALLKKYGREE